MSTTNWHLPKALPVTEQQGRLPSASAEIEPYVAAAVDLQHLLGSSGRTEALCVPGNLVGQVFRELDIFRD